MITPREVGRGLLKRTWLVLFGLSILLLAGTASADRVQWKTTRIDEDDDSWKVELTIYLSRPPPVAHMPLRFSFTPTVVYERSLIDGKDEPVLNRMPLANQQPLVESVDVGFLDPGQGKIQSRTKFSFRITRDLGFQAGEYDVEMKWTRDGRKLGGKTRLVLEGENKVVDRRSMVFEGKKKKKKEEPKDYQSQENQLSPEDEAFWEGGPTEAETEEEEAPPPQSMQEKPGACGCRLHDSPAPPPLSLAGLGLLAGLLYRRRRG